MVVENEPPAFYHEIVAGGITTVHFLVKYVVEWYLHTFDVSRVTAAGSSCDAAVSRVDGTRVRVHHACDKANMGCC